MKIAPPRLLDEVLAGLNPHEIADMIPVVRSIRAAGVTVLMIEHVMQAVMNLAEHVYVLSNGKLIAAVYAVRLLFTEYVCCDHALSRLLEYPGAISQIKLVLLIVRADLPKRIE